MPAAQDVRGVRRWPRFRLRTLLALVSIACLSCGWEANRLHRRAQAVAHLEKWEHLVFCCDTADAKRLPWSLIPGWAAPWFDSWRWSWTAVDTDPDIHWAAQLPVPVSARWGEPPWWLPTGRVRVAPSVDDRKRIVAAIATLTELESVELTLELDDDDLRVLSSLAGVDKFAFKTRRLTVAGAEHVARLQKIERLMLFSDRPDFLTVEAAAVLGRLPRLGVIIINAPVAAEHVGRLQAAVPHVPLGVNSTFRFAR